MTLPITGTEKILLNFVVPALPGQGFHFFRDISGMERNENVSIFILSST